MISTPGAPSSRQLAELVARYVAHLEHAYRSRAWMNARSHLARLLLAVDRLDFEQLRDAARELAADAQLSKSYRQDVVSTWRRFLAWCSEELLVPAELVDRFAHVRLRFRAVTLEEISSEPAQPGEPPRRGRRPRVATRTAPDPRRSPDAFFAAVSDALPSMHRDLRDVVQLLLLTGARPGELLALRSADVDTSCVPWVARLDEHKTSDHSTRPRLIVLVGKAANLIDRRLTPFTPDDWLFPAPKDPARSISRDLVQKRLRRTLTRAQLPTWTLYDARRWAATTVRGSGALDDAQALLGHSRASTTEIYAPPLRDGAVRAAELLARRAAG